VRAGELDCPQDNQALQASMEFRFETGLSIVFIQCWQQCFLLLQSGQSILGVLRKSQSQKAAQINPREFIINNAILLLNLFLKASPEVNSKRFTEREMGKTKSP